MTALKWTEYRRSYQNQIQVYSLNTKEQTGCVRIDVTFGVFAQPLFAVEKQ
jgi:hypothetical protein